MNTVTMTRSHAARSLAFAGAIAAVILLGVQPASATPASATTNVGSTVISSATATAATDGVLSPLSVITATGHCNTAPSCSFTFNHTNSNPITVGYSGNSAGVSEHVGISSPVACSWASSASSYSNVCSNSVSTGTYTIYVLNPNSQSLTYWASFTL